MNEKCYIISFELLPQRSDESLITTIKSYGTWAKINSTTWAVVTDESAVIVRDKILEQITTGDRLFVIKSGIEAAWNHVACSSEWLKKNL